MCTYFGFVVHLCWTTTIMLKMDTKHMVHGSPSIKPNWTHNLSPLCDLCARITSQTCNMPWWRQWLKAPTLVGPWNCLFFFYCHKSNVKHYKQVRHVTCGLTFSRFHGCEVLGKVVVLGRRLNVSRIVPHEWTKGYLMWIWLTTYAYGMSMVPSSFMCINKVVWIMEERSVYPRPPLLPQGFSQEEFIYII